MAASRNSVVRREEISDTVRRRIWARAAGRCVLCSQWLLDSRSSPMHTVLVGEIAHNVGATAGENSPRGDADVADRNAESNLLLLCHSCHRSIDSVELISLYTSEYLAEKKAKHERRVREVTDFATLRQTTVVRVVGSIRESTSGVAPGQLAEALLARNLTGFGEDTRTGDFFVQLIGDEEHEWFWNSGKAAIDKELTKVQDAIAHGDTTHVSVFAIAPIPLLVYLGAKLDDKTEIILFERHRTSTANPWTWPQNPEPAPEFEVVVRSEGRPDHSEVVVVVSVSADVSTERLPVTLLGLPLVEVRPAGAAPRSGLIDSLRALDGFAKVWRACLTQVERRWPSARRIHVIAAVPVTVAIQMGRDRMRTAQPDLVLYQRTDHATYTEVLEVTG